MKRHYCEEKSTVSKDSLSNKSEELEERAEIKLTTALDSQRQDEKKKQKDESEEEYPDYLLQSEIENIKNFIQDYKPGSIEEINKNIKEINSLREENERNQSEEVFFKSEWYRTGLFLLLQSLEGGQIDPNMIRLFVDIESESEIQKPDIGERIIFGIITKIDQVFIRRKIAFRSIFASLIRIIVKNSARSFCNNTDTLQSKEYKETLNKIKEWLEIDKQIGSKYTANTINYVMSNMHSFVTSQVLSIYSNISTVKRDLVYYNEQKKRSDRAKEEIKMAEETERRMKRHVQCLEKKRNQIIQSTPILKEKLYEKFYSFIPEYLHSKKEFPTYE